MRKLIVVFIFLNIGFLISCSAIYDISYDYDRTTDFTSLKSYSWLQVPEKSDTNSLDAIRIKFAVNAARLSLSPNLISSFAIESFSLITGIIFFSSKLLRVDRALRYLSRSLKSLWVKRICAEVTFFLEKSF